MKKIKPLTPGERIRIVREKTTLSREKFGSAMNPKYSGSYVNAVESGERRVSDDFLSALIRRFPTVSKEWILEGDGPEPEIEEVRVIDSTPSNSAYKDEALEALKQRALFAEKEVEFLRDLINRLVPGMAAGLGKLKDLDTAAVFRSMMKAVPGSEDANMCPAA